MKKLFYIVVGAIFLFASCQSDLIENDDSILNQVSKSDNVMKVNKEINKVKKEITFMSYEGIIEFIPNQGDCAVQFMQTGGGIASHIGKYALVNTACAGPDGLGEMLGVITAANGDEIYTRLDNIKCDINPEIGFCPGEYATFTYEIAGGSGRFDEADGWIYIYGIFVPEGPFGGAIGWGTITY